MSYGNWADPTVTLVRLVLTTGLYVFAILALVGLVLSAVHGDDRGDGES